MNDNAIRSAVLKRLAQRESWPSSGEHTFHEADATIDHLLALGDAIEWSVSGQAGTWGLWQRLPEIAQRSILAARMDFAVRVSDHGRKLLTKVLPARAHQQTEPSRAKMLFDWAVDATGNPKLGDQAAYKYIREHAEDEPLPNVNTWTRYLRRARNAEGTQKRQPRAGRTGRSIAPRRLVT